MRTRTNNRAFTLIEILIVVVILGILAAIVIPQFTDASEDAMDASVRSQLQTIRSQIELHNVQNPADQYDAGTAADAAFWDNLVNRNYLQQAPRNPMQNGSITVAGVPGVGTGWVWIVDVPSNTGDIFAVDVTGAQFDES